jgi:hypothetical protein
MGCTIPEFSGAMIRDEEVMRQIEEVAKAKEGSR